MAAASAVIDLIARDKASKTLDGVGKKADDTSKRFDGLKVAAVALGAAGGAAVVAFGAKAISSASDLNESLSKARTVFGDASKGVEAFAETAAKSLGQSKQQALEATATFGNLFSALGIGKKPAADLSTSLVKLAGDLASFNNVDPAEALDALKSGLLGEAEPMRKFGVTLSAARVSAEALADGLVKPVKNSAAVKSALLVVEQATLKAREATKKHGATSLEARQASDALSKANATLAKATKGTVPELNAAQKAQAAYRIIMKDTTTAQGDFSRTSNGLANQQRILKAELEDVSAKIGTALLPYVTKLANKISTDVVPVISRFADGMQKGTGSGGHFADELRRVADAGASVWRVVSPVVNLLVAHPKVFESVAVGAAALAAAFKVQALYGAVVSKFMPGLAASTAAEGTAAAGAATANASNAAAMRASAGALGLYAAALVNVRYESGKYADFLKKNPQIMARLGISADQVRRQSNKAQERGAEPNNKYNGTRIPGHVPALADGGIVRARTGGTLALIGEAGRDEAVIPLPRNGGVKRTGGDIHITVNGAVDPQSTAKQIVQLIRRYKNESGGGALGIA